MGNRAQKPDIPGSLSAPVGDRPTMLNPETTDDGLIALWLNDLSTNTQDAYRRDVQQFREHLSFKPLRSITLNDVQQYLSWLKCQNMTDSTRRRKTNSLKSLFSFATRMGYTVFNVMVVVKLPKKSAILTQRFIKPAEGKKLLKQQPGKKGDRNRLLLNFLFATGARVSEVCALTWNSFHERDDGSIQVTIVGKGQKLRYLVVPEQIWRQLQGLRCNAAAEARVFGIGRNMAGKIVKQAVEAAEINPDISCHWLRHLHAKTALRNGASLELVRDSLGHSSIAVTNWYLESEPEDSSSNYLGL